MSRPVITLGDLAAYLGLVAGDADPSLALGEIASLDRAGPASLAFMAERRYLGALRGTAAGCVILRAEWASQSPVPVLCADDPYLAYARASRLFEVSAAGRAGVAMADDPAGSPGVHPLASVHASATVPASARIGPFVHIGAGVVLGDEVIVASGCHIGANVRIGEASWLAPNVVLYHDVVLGARCRVHSGTVIGADGFGFARGPSGWERIAQLGSVRIGDDVDIGAGVTIDRGALDDTVIANGVIIDDQVHVAHNCRIGERTALAGCVGIAGSTTIGADCTFAGQVGVSGHLKICDNVHFTGKARVTRSIDVPGSYSSGTPLEPTRQWARNAVRFTQLEVLQRRLADLEARLGAQDAQGPGKEPGKGPGIA